MVIQITSQTTQLHHRLGARFSMNTKSNDAFYMLEAVYLLSAEIGDKELNEYLKEKYGENYEKQLKVVSMLLNEQKFYFDQLEKKEKTVDVKEVDTPLFNKYKKCSQLIGFIETKIIFSAYVFLLKQCNLKDSRIPTEHFKSEERLYLKMDRWSGRDMSSKPNHPSGDM